MRVIRSVDSGRHWQLDNDGIQVERIDELATFKGVLFAETPLGLFRSKDLGENWQLPRYDFEYDFEQKSTNPLGDRAHVDIIHTADKLIVKQMSRLFIHESGDNWRDITFSGEWSRKMTTGYLPIFSVSDDELIATDSNEIRRFSIDDLAWGEPAAIQWPEPEDRTLTGEKLWIFDAFSDKKLFLATSNGVAECRLRSRHSDFRVGR